MRKSMGTILLFFGIGVLIALFGMITRLFLGEAIMWVYVIAVTLIGGGAMMIDTEEEDDRDEDD